MAENNECDMEIGLDPEVQQKNGDNGDTLAIKKEAEEPEENALNSTPDDDDDDPIIEEIPVFLAKALAKKLYLFQVKLLIWNWKINVLIEKTSKISLTYLSFAGILSNYQLKVI